MTGAGVAAAFVAAVFLGVYTVGSMALFLEFLDSGELYLEPFSGVCILVFFVIGIACFAPNVANALFVIRSSKSERTLRSAYLLVVYPTVFFSFLLATMNTSFTPSLTFGWPLFLLGAIAYPWAALVLHGEVKHALLGNSIMVRCRHCTYLFRMHIAEERMRCLYCGEENENPHLQQVLDHKEGRATRGESFNAMSPGNGPPEA
jgi:hypothetical protein